MDTHLLEKFIQGTCTPEEAAQVEAWLEEHPAALDAYLQRTWEEDVSHPMPAAMEAAILQEVLPRPAAKRRRLPLWAAAAAVTLLAIAGVWYWQSPGGPVTHAALLAATTSPQQFVLPDGSRLWLRENSRASFDSVTFGASGRQVELLEGEAFFDVTQNEQQPFQVLSNGVNTTVLGTSFSVRLQNGVSIAVATGKVAVGRNGSTLAQVTPGQELKVNTATGQHTITTIPAWMAGAWKEDTLQLTDASFEVLRMALSAFYNVQLEDEGGKASAQVYNIRLEKSTPAEDVIKVLGMLNGITYTKKDASTYIIH